MRTNKKLAALAVAVAIGATLPAFAANIAKVDDTEYESHQTAFVLATISPRRLLLVL